MSFFQTDTYVFGFIVCFALLSEFQNVDCAIIDRKFLQKRFMG